MDITADILKELVPEGEIEYPIDALNKFFYQLDYTALGESFPWLDSKIQYHSLGYVFIGACLQRIRHHHLYKQDFRDFKEYCQKALGKSYAYCLRLIQAAQTTWELMSNGFDRLPACESQIRPIAQVLPKDKFGNVIVSDLALGTPSPHYLWQQVLNIAGEGIITSQLVQQTVDAELDLTPKEQEKKRRIAITGKLNQKLSQIAIAEGKTTEQILAEMIERRFYELNLAENNEASEDPAEASLDEDQKNSTATATASEIPSSPNWEEDLNLLLEFYDANRLVTSEHITNQPHPPP